MPLVTAQDLPKGVSVGVSDKGNAIISIEEDTEIVVTRKGKDGQTLLIGSSKGVLQALQIDSKGMWPVSVEFTSSKEAKITITRGPEGDWRAPFTVDSNGDGIPDFKVDGTGKYRLKKIEWEKVQPEEKSEEQGGAGQPATAPASEQKGGGKPQPESKPASR